jgi:hypothetical protein
LLARNLPRRFRAPDSGGRHARSWPWCKLRLATSNGGNALLLTKEKVTALFIERYFAISLLAVGLSHVVTTRQWRDFFLWLR